MILDNDEFQNLCLVRTTIFRRSKRIIENTIKKYDVDAGTEIDGQFIAGFATAINIVAEMEMLREECRNEKENNNE